MSKEFLDSDLKFIAECPECSNQESVYMVDECKLKEGYHVIDCYSCEKPYVILIEPKLIVTTKYFKTTEHNEQEVCPECDAKLSDAKGIGLFCPNSDCKVIDNYDNYEKEGSEDESN